MKRCEKCNFPLEGLLAKLLKPILKISASENNPSVCTRCDEPKSISKSEYICSICNRPVDESSALTHVKAEEYLLGLIKKDHPEWQKEKGACPQCLDYYRELIKKAKI